MTGAIPASVPLAATWWRPSSTGGTAGALTTAFWHGQFGCFAGVGWTGFGAVTAFTAAAHRGQPFAGVVFAAAGCVGGAVGVAAQQHARGPTRTESR